MHVNVRPALILKGRIVIGRVVIAMKNVFLVTVTDLLLGQVVLVPANQRKTKAKAAVLLAMTLR